MSQQFLGTCVPKNFFLGSHKELVQVLIATLLAVTRSWSQPGYPPGRVAGSLGNGGGRWGLHKQQLDECVECIIDGSYKNSENSKNLKQ